MRVAGYLTPLVKKPMIHSKAATKTNHHVTRCACLRLRGTAQGIRVAEFNNPLYSWCLKKQGYHGVDLQGSKSELFMAEAIGASKLSVGIPTTGAVFVTNHTFNNLSI